ncbi:MAG TPA: hypothetical protein VE871_03510 [Longimicrobium sp.]|nr:hypothetical protein [Longimicrobium sp.]
MAGAAPGCASADYGTVMTSHPGLPTRAVFLNRHGVGVPVRVVGQEYPVETKLGAEYDAHVHRMMNELRRDRQPRGVMIVVHGGMNGFAASRGFAEVAGDNIHADGYNPIFLNWRTNPFNSYYEHMMWTRRGHIVDGPAAAINTPLNVVADLGRGVTRWPLNVTESFGDDQHTLGGDLSSLVSAEYDSVRAHYGERSQVRASLGTYCTSGSSRRAAWIRAPLVPVRLAVGLPLSETFGTSSWKNMVRRSRNVFRQPAESVHEDSAYGGVYRPGRGGASVLMDSLQRLVRDDEAAGFDRRVTLIGHSMGAIVLNEVVRLYPSMKFDTIVYMAAAASTRDVYESVLPYLAAHKKTQFYNLTLHPNADAREHWVPWLPILPVGSLLEAIDDIYENPLTHVDRVFGKWTNAMETLHLIPDSVRGQVTIKGFGYNDPNHEGYGVTRGDPGVHGDFNEVDLGFWKPEFWMATPPPGPGRPDRDCSGNAIRPSPRDSVNAQDAVATPGAMQG